MNSGIFWLVWCPKNGSPMRMHTSRIETGFEAERLAAKHPGSDFFVLQTLSASRTKSVVTEVF